MRETMRRQSDHRKEKLNVWDETITIRSIFFQIKFDVYLDLVLVSFPFVGKIKLRDSPLNIGNHSNIIL